MFDERKAQRVIRFIENLKHTKGAFYGKKFELLPWQREFVSNVFGTVRDDDPTIRQYTSSYLEIPKKQGKSEIGAALALNMLCNDDEYRAEVYGCAADRQQAGIVFEVACDMVRMCPALAKRIKIVPSTKRMVYIPTGSIYQVLSAEVATKHGLNVSACIFDELHTQPTRALYDVMTQGSGDARRQPLFIFLTTAGHDRNSICWKVHQKALDIIAGRKSDPRFYPVVYGLGDDEDWTDEKNWYKANPSLGITIDIEKVRDQFRNALDDPGSEIAFRQLRLNQWVSSEISWMKMSKWDACATPVDADALRGRKCYAGIDLSSTSDLTALVLVFPPEEDDEPYWVLPYYWCPKDAIKHRTNNDHVPYEEWAKVGHIIATEGDVVDYTSIKAKIMELGSMYEIVELIHDPWNATMLMQELEDEGLVTVRHGQTYRDMTLPTKLTMIYVNRGVLAHGGHPILRWNMENAVLVVDDNKNKKISKKRSPEKIDGCIALIMALGRAIANEGGSIYDDDDHELVVI